MGKMADGVSRPLKTPPRARRGWRGRRWACTLLLAAVHCALQLSP